MPSWSGCRVEVDSAEGDETFVGDDCDVRLEQGRLLVSYFDEDGPVVYASTGGDGTRFELVCRSRPCVAWLALSPDGARLAGSWCDSGGAEAAWRIELGTPD